MSLTFLNRSPSRARAEKAPVGRNRGPRSNWTKGKNVKFYLYTPARLLRRFLVSAVLAAVQIGIPYHGASAEVNAPWKILEASGLAPIGNRGEGKGVEAGSAIQTGPRGRIVLGRTLGTSRIDIHAATKGLVKEAETSAAMSSQSANRKSRHVAGFGNEWRKPTFLGTITTSRAAKETQVTAVRDTRHAIKATLTGREETTTSKPKFVTR